MLWMILVGDTEVISSHINSMAAVSATAAAVTIEISEVTTMTNLL